jgi:peroxiredoxin
VNNLNEKPFALLGVNGMSPDPKKLKSVMEKEKLNWRTFADDGTISNTWSARSTPAYFALDHKGVIRYKWLGYPGMKAIDEALEKLLKEM